jgi:DNA polymerase III subunit epsilon
MSHVLKAILAKLPDHRRLVAIDMETTGNRAPTPEALAKAPKGLKPPGLVIEIGCVELLFDGGEWRKGETWSERVRPDAPSSPGSIKVHGIRPNDLNKAPRFHEIADSLLAFLGDAPLVAHAALNEYGYLNYEFRRAGRCKWDEEMFPEPRFFCTQKLSHEVFPRQSGSLDALCDRLWIDRSDRFEKHGALLDADLTADAFVKFVTGDVDQKNMEIS